MSFRGEQLVLDPGVRRRLNRALRRELRDAGMPETWGVGSRAETKILMLSLLRLWDGPGAGDRRRRDAELG